MRIISTVPSITELLADLGLGEEVVGITKFCIHPKKWFNSKERIGGTKNLNIDKIIKINPDLIIANKEENTKDQILELKKHFEVYLTDIKTISHNYQLIKDIGRLTNSNEKAQILCSDLQHKISSLKIANSKPAVYLIWQDPYMTVGSDTFINEIMTLCGFENLFSNQTRYPATSIEEIKNSKPEYILLSSEPFPFSEKHIKAFEQEFSNSKILLVDGEAFSWYGTRLIKKHNYLNKIASL